MARPASLIFITAISAPLLAGCCASRYPARYGCPPRPAAAYPPGPCNGYGPRHYGPSYLYQPAYPPSAGLYPPAPPAAVRPMPNPAGPWQPGPGQPGVSEYDNGIKLRPPIHPPDGPKPGGESPQDIPDFQLVLTNVASGRQPFADGYEWLRANRYRAVLYLRGPGEEDGLIRQAVESRGMGFHVLDVSPNKLDRGLVESFNRIVDDTGNQPLFVFDRSGMARGTMWYLYFRTAKGEPDSVARDLGKKLGLREGEEYADWWLAIQKLASK